MSEEITLENRDGRIVGIDPESGEEIPVEWGDLSPDRIGSEDDRTEAVHSAAVDAQRLTVDATALRPEVVEREENVTGRYLVVGDRHGAALTRGTRWHGPTLFSDRAERTWTGDAVLERIDVRPFFHGPEIVPILYLDARLRNRTAGEEARLRLRLLNARGEVPEVSAAVSEDDRRRVYAETYLADDDHTATAAKKEFPTLELAGEATGGTGELGPIRVGLEYEVR